VSTPRRTDTVVDVVVEAVAPNAAVVVHTAFLVGQRAADALVDGVANL
jgi:hypothetical protein